MCTRNSYHGGPIAISRTWVEFTKDQVEAGPSNHFALGYIMEYFSSVKGLVSYINSSWIRVAHRFEISVYMYFLP